MPVSTRKYLDRFLTPEQTQILFRMAERFLLDEALLAEKQLNFKRIGEANAELYGLFARADGVLSTTLSEQMAYRYGTEAVKYNDEFKYRILFHYGCHQEFDDGYNPYLSLGYTQTDAQEYASKLAAAGDPRGQELRAKIAEDNERRRANAAEGARARAKAFWEENKAYARG